ADHTDCVTAAVENWAGAPAPNVVRRAWSRAIGAYGLSPEGGPAPHILTAGELRPLQEEVEHLVAHARDEMDRLYNIVRQLGYVVLLANHDSVIVDHRGE